MNEPLNVMVDLETLGTRPGAVIVSIGAVVFDADGPDNDLTFEERIDIDSCLRCGLTVDGGTLEWWLRQNDRARAIFQAKGKPLTQALADFAGWLAALPGGLRLWGNGASFDCALLAEAYRRAGWLELPWKYTAERCYRTLAALRPELPKAKALVAHCALDDALAQAAHAATILRGTESRRELEWTRAMDALDSAGITMLRGGSEEPADGICKLAGERDEARATLVRLREMLGLPATTTANEILRRILHLQARHQLKEEFRCTT